ncbi:MAG: hypothetical protein JSR65_13215 [Proteobacteria bacterium]|nr:hypothetical protein [Pseudomonadota bacterium]
MSKKPTTLRNSAWYGWLPDLPDKRDQLVIPVFLADTKRGARRRSTPSECAVGCLDDSRRHWLPQCYG